MRRVRMLGLCLVAACALSAVAAAPGLAAKDPYSAETWEQYKYCPFAALDAAEAEGRLGDCFVGRTSGGSAGGFFSLGNVTVKLNKPITLRGGFYYRSREEKEAFDMEEQECKANPECKTLEEEPNYFYFKEGELKVVPAEGAPTLESPELKVNKGLNLITSGVQERSEWPQALVESFKEAKKNKETALDVKIEVAGNGLFENFGGLSTERLLFERGPAFQLPLKVRMINPWLEKLGGGPCEVGNDAHPVMQDLTTEPPGRSNEPGGFGHNEEFTNVELKGGRLVDLSWSVPTEGDASGCGGPYEAYVDAAINEVLELPHQHGTTVLQGDLFTAQHAAAQNEIEFGHE